MGKILSVKRVATLRRTILSAVLSMLLTVPLLHAGPADAADENTLLLATTTSIDNTGLLDYLMPVFSINTGILVSWISAGTGKALKLGENCDVDVLLIHDPQSEKVFVDSGYGLVRREIMYNDFVLIGPAGDPADIRGKNVSGALQAIKASEAVFVSRGDNSGTHKKEGILWQVSEMSIPQKATCYRESGQGMLATINIAAELNGYTLTDRGTYIKYESVTKGNPELVILVEDDPVLLNQYSIIPVNPKHCPDAKHEMAEKLSDWMAGREGQNLIRDYKLSGKKLFVPNANRE